MHQALPIAQLLNVLGQVDGRKKLQKMVHILQELGQPFPQRFEYCYYGMYSQQLREQIELLEADRLVSQSPRGMGFAYESQPQLDQLLAELGVDREPSWAALARELNAHSAQELEAVSTIYFLGRLGFAGEMLKQRLLELKPHLAPVYEQSTQLATALRARPA